MKLNKKFITGGMVTAVTCALVGSITGTFAWYGYSTRGTAALTGTTIDKSANLQLGIVGASTQGNLESDGNIAWSKIGGGLNQADIKSYLENDMQRSYNSMKPTTSGINETKSLVLNDNFDKLSLISDENPYYIEKTVQNDIAPKALPLYQYNNISEAANEDDYIVLPLAMRVSDLKGNYLKGQEIYVSHADVSILNNKEDTKIASAMRVDFKTFNELNDQNQAVDAKHVILAPGKVNSDNADFTTGKTELGGLLDLNGDGYVDVKEEDYAYKARHELVYGYTEDSTLKTERVNIEISNSMLGGTNGVQGITSIADIPEGQFIYLEEGFYKLGTFEGNIASENRHPTYLYNKVGDEFELATEDKETLVDNLIYHEWNVSNDFYKEEENKSFAYVKNGNGKISAEAVELEDSAKKVSESILVKGDQGISPVDKPEGNFESFKVYELDGNEPAAYVLAGDEDQLFNEDSVLASHCYYIVDNEGIKIGYLVNDFALVEKNNALELHLLEGEEEQALDLKFIYVEQNNKLVKKATNHIGNDEITSSDRPVHLPKEFEQRKHLDNTLTVEGYKAFEQTWYGNVKNNGTNNAFIADFGTDGRLVAGTALCETSSDDDAIVYCTLTIWLEGWETSLDSNDFDVQFGLGLQFQIDRID